MDLNNIIKNVDDQVCNTIWNKMALKCYIPTAHKKLEFLDIRLVQFKLNFMYEYKVEIRFIFSQILEERKLNEFK